MMKKTLLLGALLASAAASPAYATTKTFCASEDAMIFASSSNVDTGNASGQGPGMFAGADASGNKKRSLLKFDFSDDCAGGGGITGANTVVKATLTMYIGQIAGSGGGGGGGGSPGSPGGGCGTSCTPASRTFYVHKVTSAWNEGTSGSTACGGVPCANMSGTGQGWTAGTGDVTWSKRIYSGTSWTAGPSNQDYDATPLVTETFTNFTFYLPMTWSGDKTVSPNVNASFVNLINDWLDNVTPNNGLLVKSNVEGTNQSFIGWWTRDGAMASGVSSVWPTLTVEY